MNIRILAELRCEPRLTMVELGRRVGLSSPAATARVRRLEESGVIRGYMLEIDPGALGLSIGAYVRIRPNSGSGQLSQIIRLAQEIPEVVECHRITGEDCFILKVYIPAMEQLDRLLDSFLQYGTTTTLIIQSSPVPPRPLPVPLASESFPADPLSLTSSAQGDSGSSEQQGAYNQQGESKKR